MRIITQDQLYVTRGRIGGRDERRRIDNRFAYHTENGPPVQGPGLAIPLGVSPYWQPMMSKSGQSGPSVLAVDADGTHWSSDAIIAATLNELRIGGFSYGSQGQGALLESQRSNLVYPSAGFDSWTATNCIVAANDAVAPDGTTTAEKLTQSGGDAGNVKKATDSLTDNLAYAVSIWIKKGTAGVFTLVLHDATAGTARAEIDFIWTAGVLAVNNEDVGTGYVEAGTGGWYRAIALVPANTIVGANSNEVRIYTGELGDLGGTGLTMYAWGAQCEQGTYATTHIPTTSAAVQRDADGFEYTSADMAAGAHTLYATIVPNWNGTNENNDHYVLDTRTGSDPGCCIYHDGSHNVLVAETLPSAGAAGAATSTTAVVRASAYVVALAFDTNDLIFRVHDVGDESDDDATDSTVALPSSHQALAIGRDKADANQWDGLIRDVLVYQWRHTAEQLRRNIAWLAARAA